MKIKDRIKELRRVKASELVPNPKNWRTHPTKQKDALKGVLSEIGYADALLARELPDGSLMLLDGHLRAETTPEQEVPVLVLDLNEEESDKLLATLDPLASLAEQDDEKLAELLESIETENEALQELLDDLAGEEIEEIFESGENDDSIPEVNEKPDSQRGEIYKLGNHRLMCGDSTSADDFAKLMNGERADIAFTSPPYGVNDGSLREHKVAGKSSHENNNFYKTFNDNQDVWPQLIEESWKRMHENSDQQFINIQMLRDNKRELVRWCARHADNLCDIMIWDKGSCAPQIQKNVLNNTFEFIYIFGEDNTTRVLKHGTFHGNISAVIQINVEQNKYADVHNAVFPVALPREILTINGNAKSVIDCFGGTGTTIIAAEQLERKCYMMEIDPLYCDVIRKRWAEYVHGEGCDWKALTPAI